MVKRRVRNRQATTALRVTIGHSQSTTLPGQHFLWLLYALDDFFSSLTCIENHVFMYHHLDLVLEMVE